MPYSSASILLGTLATCATKTGKHPHCAFSTAPAWQFHTCPSMIALAMDVQQAPDARAGVLHAPCCRACSRCLLKAGLTQRVQA